MNEQFIIIIIGIVLLPFFICLISIPFFLFQRYLILKYKKKYSSLSNKMPIDSYFTLKGESFKRLSLIFRILFLLESFSQKYFNKSFEKLYNYKAIKKTKNKKFIYLISKHRKLLRFYFFIFTIYILLILIGIIIFLFLGEIR